MNLKHIARQATLLSILGVLTLPVAWAARASAASVEKLVGINGAQKALEQAVGGIEAQVRSQVVMSLLQQNGGAPLNAQQQTAVNKVVPAVGAVLRREMGWPNLKDPYVKLYQAQLNQDEVNRLIKLYEDPGYQTLMQKMQTVNLQSAQLIQQQLPVILQKIQPVLEDTLKDALKP